MGHILMPWQNIPSPRYAHFYRVYLGRLTYIFLELFSGWRKGKLPDQAVTAHLGTDHPVLFAIFFCVHRLWKYMNE